MPALGGLVDNIEISKDTGPGSSLAEHLTKSISSGTLHGVIANNAV